MRPQWDPAVPIAHKRAKQYALRVCFCNLTQCRNSISCGPTGICHCWPFKLCFQRHLVTLDENY